MLIYGLIPPMAGRNRVNVKNQGKMEKLCFSFFLELGRGRFSVVRRCHEIMSGNDVAVKFVNRRKQGEAETLREYRHLAQLNHPHIISSLGLYLTSNSYAIVLTL